MSNLRTKLAGKKTNLSQKRDKMGNNEDHPLSMSFNKNGHYNLVKIDSIIPNPNQPRQHVNKAKLEELTKSIKERGVLQPIRVRPKNDKLEIIAGERRWQASKLAGLSEIPCIIVSQDDQEASIDALVENLQREDLNAIDRANGLTELRKILGNPSWEEIGKKIGLARRQVFNLLGLKSLPEKVQQDIKENILTARHGFVLKTLLNDEAKFEEAYTRIKAEELTAEEAQDLAKSLKKALNPDIEKEYKAFKNTLMKYQDLLLFTNVQHFEAEQKEDLKKLFSQLKEIISKTVEKL